MKTDTPIGTITEPCEVCGAPVTLTVHADKGAPDIRLTVDETNMDAHQLEHSEGGEARELS